MARDPQTVAMANAVLRLFDKGNVDPNAQEIAAEYYGSVVITKKEVEIVQAKLRAIKRYLEAAKVNEEGEEEEGLKLYLVNEAFYEKKRRLRWGANRQVPDTLSDAQKCLPLGWKVKAYGIRFLTDLDDTIWLATTGHRGAVAAGQMKKVQAQIEKANHDALASDEVASRMLKELDARSLPEEPSGVLRLKAWTPPALPSIPSEATSSEETA